MRVIQDSQTHSVIRFEKGERFIESFREWLISRNIQGAFFYGLGGALFLKVAFYDMNTKAHTFKDFTGGHFEILSLTGNVALLEGSIKIHSHVSFSDSAFHAHGGHLEDLEVGGTLEIYVQRIESLERAQNNEVGLALLHK
jgi:predicted DNA-binding protein with PD1-like motif